MRHVCLALGLGILLGGCKKDDVVPAYMRERPHAVSRVVIPGPFLPVLPRVPLVLTRCVNSYEDLVLLIGEGPVAVKSVVLENGVEIICEAGLCEVNYNATPHLTGSSLFDSQLSAIWRADVNDYWAGFSAEVWSAGCVYTSSNAGPFTNLLKDGAIIAVNTCFFWSLGEHAGLRIKHLVL